MNAAVEKSLWGIATLLVGAALVLAWQQVADAQLISSVFLPGPQATWKALQHGFENGILGAMFLETTQRMAYGWLLSALVGVLVGALIGMSPSARAYLEPTLEAIRPLPASAIIPVAIALFGLGETTVYSVICFGSMWPMLLATIHGFSAVEPTLYEFARGIGMSRARIILKIALPSSMPDILGGLKVSMAIALVLTVVTEMLVGQQGLGTWILLAGRSYRAADVFAGIALLGLLGYVSSLLLSLAEMRLLRWQRRRG